jgi:protein gp37
MSDIFHSEISNVQIAAMFAVMAACPQHTFQLLTKRPARMLEWFSWVAEQMRGDNAPRGLLHDAIGRTYNDVYGGLQEGDAQTPLDAASEACCDLDVWPLPNVWVGVSVEDQQRANERIPLLRQTPAAIRWMSVEPLLERVELDLLGIDWVVVGGESGPRARQCHRQWIQDIVQQCRRANVAGFVKQLGGAYCDPENAIGGAQTPRVREYGPIRKLADPKGANMDEWPPELRVREFPTSHFGGLENASGHPLPTTYADR